MSQTITQSMSTSISKIKDYLLIFGHTDGFWGSRVKGFTHLILVKPMEDGVHGILLEPLFQGGELDVILLESLKNPDFLADRAILKVTVKAKAKNRLIIPLIQTCTTLIQYMTSISLGALTPQGLYECLTKSDEAWLNVKGIKEVREWVQ